MRLSIAYDVPFSGRRPIRFSGRGSLHVLETGLLFEGSISPFYMMGLTWIVDAAISFETVRTVPYRRIVHMGQGWMLRRRFRLEFEDINDEIFVIGFRLVGESRSERPNLLEQISGYQSQLTSEY